MSADRPGASRLVYSTDSGRVCPGCGRAVAACACAKQPVRAPSDGIVRVALDTQGRKGKGVTVVRGVPLDDAALIALAKQLKAACGSGGTVKDGMIEVQGDHREKVVGLLTARGWVVKRVGG